MQGQTFVFFGIAGSGKGTQMELLEKYVQEKEGKGFVYAGTGDGFRNLISAGNHVSELVKNCLDKGELMPDFFATSIITDIFVSKLMPDQNLITDGYPRTVKQSEDFEKMLKFFGRSKVEIIYIELSREEALKRNLLRNRHDDTEESIQKRFDWYFDMVLPAMNYFEGKPGFTIHKINGEQTKEEVYRDIINALKI